MLDRQVALISELLPQFPSILIGAAEADDGVFVADVAIADDAVVCVEDGVEASLPQVPKPD